jgi:predicted permease
LLVRLGQLRASDAELGDVMEEYAAGNRNALWLTRQIMSTFRLRSREVVWRASARQIPFTVHERRAEMLSTLWSDVRYALRTLFSILNSVAWRPLPAPEPAELVTIYQQFQGVKRRTVHGARSLFSIPEYRAYRDGTQTLSGLMAYSHSWTLTLGGPPSQEVSGGRFGAAGPLPMEIEGVLVTCNYFDVLRLRPALGTGFTAANCGSPAASPAVIVSHALWTRAFAADPEIVRKTITLNGQSVAVAGVAPEGFDGIDMQKAAFFAPTSLQTLLRPEQDYHEDPHTSWLRLVGRRDGGAAMAQVRTELAVIARHIDQQQPGRTTVLSVEPATTLSLPVARRNIMNIAAVVMAAFGLVLLIACANVANLLLGRAAGRTKEIAVRLAVGASRWRLMQQLLTESLIIALAGGVAGVILAWWSFQALLLGVLSALPGMVPQVRVDAHPDPAVLWFAFALMAVTALVFGMVPALQASKPDVHAVMKQDGADSGGRTAGWVRGTLISVQVAVCMVLLISAGLLLRALYAAQTIDPGFDSRHVAVVSVGLSGPGYDDRKVVAFRQRLTERISSLPGVDGLAQVSKIPLSPGRVQSTFRLSPQGEGHEVDVNNVSPEYFSLVGIPIVRGRTFQTAGLEDETGAVIVTEATARRYWPGEDPIGRTVIIMGSSRMEIVGVARDAHVSHVAATDSSYMYLSAGLAAQRRLNFLVRSHSDFGALTTSVRALVRELDPGLVVRVNRLEENLEFWRTGSRLIASLSGSVSLLALTLASVGVYGVVSYVVSRRRREVGIRMTLGATAGDVQRLIMRQTLRPVVAGMLVGIAGAAAASRILESVLFGISPFDPVAFIAAPVFLLGVAAAASALPTRNALRIDPMTALRYE